jgi:hypothetical protein
MLPLELLELSKNLNFAQLRIFWLKYITYIAMLSTDQLKIFLANMEDFILTRGMFSSQKTYEGLEEFANNLDETIIGEGLIPQEAREQWECKTFPKIRETLWEELQLSVRSDVPFLSGDFVKSNLPYAEGLFFHCQKACDYDAKKHIFECLTT